MITAYDVDNIGISTGPGIFICTTTTTSTTTKLTNYKANSVHTYVPRTTDKVIVIVYYLLVGHRLVVGVVCGFGGCFRCFLGFGRIKRCKAKNHLET